MGKPGRKITCSCGTCKKCKRREYARRWRERNPDATRAAQKRWLEANPEKRKEVEERYKPFKGRERAGKRAQHREQFDWDAKAILDAKKKSARWAVKTSVRTGRLTPQPCWCGVMPAQAHHDDYDKPLDVVWLCPIHHGECHRAINKKAREMNGVIPRPPRREWPEPGQN